MKEVIKKEINKAVKELFQKEVSFSIEYPESKFGDYSSNVAFSLSKDLGSNSREVAQKIADYFNNNFKTFKKVEVAGPGFLNFFLADKIFTDNVASILKLKKKYGQSKINKGKKIIVEYSSPNIAKPFTVGHLRSTIIGDALANILEFSGAKVIRDNHLGDWGTQFGKMIVAIKKWGDISKIKKSSQPVKDLVSLYVKFHEEAELDKNLDDEARGWFTKLEKKDKEAVRLWKLCIDLSSKEFEKIYKRLGISFDTTVGESFFNDKMNPIVEEAVKKGIAKVSEGATLVFFEKDSPNGETSKYPPLMLLKSDGSSLYALRDLATDTWRKKKYGKDSVIINEVGMEQSLYFKQLFETEKLLGISNGNDRFHIAHGLYSFKEGKMSTRKGNVIWLEEVLEEAKKRAEVFNKDVAEEVGIGAIKFNDLKRDSTKEIIFDWDEILNLGGDSGPYLQYSSARAYSILEKAKNKPKAVVPKDWTTSDVEKLLTRFSEVAERSALDLKPNQLALYLLDLAGAFNNFYTHNKIIGSGEGEKYRLAITEAFRTVLTNGLTLLGIKALKKM
ncbi:MAG: arginine--tRNA ligase [Candidatus Paceibacterota bacterium]